MNNFTFQPFSLTKQYLVSILSIPAIAAGCYFLSEPIGYKVVTIILLYTVSLITMFFDIKPALVAARIRVGYRFVIMDNH